MNNWAALFRGKVGTVKSGKAQSPFNKQNERDFAQISDEDLRSKTRPVLLKHLKTEPQSLPLPVPLQWTISICCMPDMTSWHDMWHDSWLLTSNYLIPTLQGQVARYMLSSPALRIHQTPSAWTAFQAATKAQIETKCGCNRSFESLWEPLVKCRRATSLQVQSATSELQPVSSTWTGPYPLSSGPRKAVQWLTDPCGILWTT